ncbi:hypothetical protein AAH979_38845 [Plantactinospora sp. ZYX-F-223]|uniref:hypothetical protein n=1 Tax=Plantactinospora sp. ZYX-F-223 TaxID=3144103 RepID=UPI0031FD4B0B
MGGDQWWSLTELNTEAPDHHHESTVDNLADIYNASESLRCFRKQHVPVPEIQQAMLHDDPEDVQANTKIESIRLAIRSGVTLPGVVLVHNPANRSPLPRQGRRYIGSYHLLEGMHRYTAAHREEAPQIYAWVAHLGCCGGPQADLEDEPLKA